MRIWQAVRRRWPLVTRRRLAVDTGLVMFLSVALLYGWAVTSRARLDAPAATPILYDRHGVYLAQIGHETPAGARAKRLDYGYWPLEAVPDRVARATLALEDRRFTDHPGVDAWAAGRAAWQWLSRAQRRSGASTIAMQIARMQRPAPRSTLGQGGGGGRRRAAHLALWPR